jgi:tetratricopeptide (TPR) repeat protein
MWNPASLLLDCFCGLVCVGFLLSPLLVLAWERIQAGFRGGRYVREHEADLANSQNAEARFRLASIYADSWRVGRAEADIAEAVRLAAESPLYDGVPHRFMRLYGDILRRRGRHDEAIRAYETSLERPSEMGYEEAHFGMGRAFQKLGRHEASLAWLRRAQEENGSRLETYFRIAQACAALGDDDGVREAEDEFRRTLEELPRDSRQPRVRWRLAFRLFPLARRIV